MTIHLYVTHYVTADLDGINDILIDQLWRMRDLTGSPIFVVHWTNDPAYTADIARRLPPDVELVENDRPGRPDTQPSLRNKIIEHARASRCEAFVLLHNDIRLARGTLRNLVSDWRAAEGRWGHGKTIISPRFVPYHLTMPDPEAFEHATFWDDLAINPNVKSAAEMATWCKPWGFTFDRGDMIAPEASEATDDGHQLMMFIAGPQFFDDVGPCDENFTGANYDDSDWGIRALLAGKKNLQSTGALVGHIGGLSFSHKRKGPPAEIWRTIANNEQVFIAKHGQAIFDEMQTGQLWLRLHRDQIS